MLTIIATKYYLTPLLIECIFACIILLLTQFFLVFFFRKRESPHLHILMNILRDMKDMIHWKHFQINFNDWSFIEHITVTKTMIMRIMTIGSGLHIQLFQLESVLRYFDQVGHRTTYSKVPIIRTGPIIRTVLIFLGTLQL